MICNSSLVYTWCSRFTVPEVGTRGDLMWTHPFFTYASMSGAFLCPSTRSKPSCTRALSCARGPSLHCTCCVSCEVNHYIPITFYLLLSLQNGVWQEEKEKLCTQLYLSGGRRTAHVRNQCMLVLSQRKWVHFWRRLDTWLTTRLYPRSLEYLAFFGLACWLVVLRVFKPKIELFVLLVFPFRFILNSKRVKALTFAFYITHTTLRTAPWKER